MPEQRNNDHPSNPDGSDRRQFLTSASKGAMVAGLVGGYGAFAAVAGRFLYPSSTGDVLWQFVADTESIKVGEAIRYRGPSGETINIARHTRNGDAEDFTALSSTCPHLGCQVRWEGQNNRFFCPCHNGVFDPPGIAARRGNGNVRSRTSSGWSSAGSARSTAPTSKQGSRSSSESSGKGRSSWFVRDSTVCCHAPSVLRIQAPRGSDISIPKDLIL